MAWVVDTCLLIDIAENDPVFGLSSADFVDRYQPFGLTVCPVTLVELAPVFGGQRQGAIEFLQTLNVRWPEAWAVADSEAAFSAWARYVTLKRQGAVRKRPLADILIGAFAQRFDGLLTRNLADFQPYFHRLTIAVP